MSGSAPASTSRRSDLNDIRVLVTGATSGLGAAMAAALARGGARVMVTGRDQLRAAETAKELGSSAISCQLDVRDERSVAACVARACDAWGSIDMLANNAGIGGEPAPGWFPMMLPPRSGLDCWTQQ